MDERLADTSNGRYDRVVPATTLSSCHQTPELDAIVEWEWLAKHRSAIVPTERGGVHEVHAWILSPGVDFKGSQV